MLKTINDKLTTILYKLPGSVVFILSVLLVIIIGTCDYLTGEEVTLYLFYVLPVFIACWRLGLWQGFAISIFSLLFWYVDSFYQRPEFGNLILSPYWNIVFQFIFFVVLVLILTSLKKSVEREKKAEREKIENELKVARDVQQKLFPQAMPAMQGLEYFGLCIPADEIGGDYFDYIKLSSDEIGFAIGDISGHGLPSALLMAGLVGFVRSNALICRDDLKQLLYRVNNLMCESTTPGKFATFFYGVYNCAEKVFRYVNAGHNPPFVFRKNNNSNELLKGGGLMIGVMPEFGYSEMQIRIEKGDVLVLYTDGITEAFDKNSYLYGEERLKTVVENNLHLSAKELCGVITKDVFQYSEGRKQADDMTLLVVRCITD